MSAVNPSSFNPVNTMDLKGMDLETAMMAVQAGRAQNLEAQMNGQIEVAKKQNEKMANLNELIGAINTGLSKFKAKDGADASFGNVEGWNSDGFKLHDDIRNAAEKAGYDLNLKTGAIKKGELEKAVADIKTKVDAAANNQQMDMIRLQSLSGKRNEAFETLTNFIKKMQDSRNSIVSNMR